MDVFGMHSRRINTVNVDAPPFAHHHPAIHPPVCHSKCHTLLRRRNAGSQHSCTAPLTRRRRRRRRRDAGVTASREWRNALVAVDAGGCWNGETVASGTTTASIVTLETPEGDCWICVFHPPPISSSRNICARQKSANNSIFGDHAWTVTGTD